MYVKLFCAYGSSGIDQKITRVPSRDSLSYGRSEPMKRLLTKLVGMLTIAVFWTFPSLVISIVFSVLKKKDFSLTCCMTCE